MQPVSDGAWPSVGRRHALNVSRLKRAWGIGMCPKKYGEMHGHVAKTTVERHRYTSSNLATLQVK